MHNIENNVNFIGKLNRKIFDKKGKFIREEEYSNIRTDLAFQITRDSFSSSVSYDFWNSIPNTNSYGFDVYFNLAGTSGWTYPNAFTNNRDKTLSNRVYWDDVYGQEGVVSFKQEDYSAFSIDGIEFLNFERGNLVVNIYYEGIKIISRTVSFGDSTINFSAIKCDRIEFVTTDIKIAQISPFFYSRLGAGNVGTGNEPIDHSTTEISYLDSVVFDSKLVTNNIATFQYRYYNDTGVQQTLTRTGLTEYVHQKEKRKLFTILETNTVLEPGQVVRDIYHLTVTSNNNPEIIANQLAKGNKRFQRLVLRSSGTIVKDANVYLNEYGRHDIRILLRLRNISFDTIELSALEDGEVFQTISTSKTIGDDPQYLLVDINFGGAISAAIVFPDDIQNSIDDIAGNKLRLEKDSLLIDTDFNPTFNFIYLWLDSSGENNHAKELLAYKNEPYNHVPKLTKDKGLWFEQTQYFDGPIGINKKALNIPNFSKSIIEGSAKQFTLISIINRNLKITTEIKEHPIFSIGRNVDGGSFQNNIKLDKYITSINNQQGRQDFELIPNSNIRPWQELIQESGGNIEQAEWYFNTSQLIEYDGTKTNNNDVYKEFVNGIKSRDFPEPINVNPNIISTLITPSIGASMNVDGSLSFSGSPETNGLNDTFDGVMEGFLVFDRILTDQEKEQVFLYLEEKYDIPYLKFITTDFYNYKAIPNQIVEYREIKDIRNVLKLIGSSRMNPDLAYVEGGSSDLEFIGYEKILTDSTPTQTGSKIVDSDFTNIYGRVLYLEVSLIEVLEQLGSPTNIIISKTDTETFDIEPENGFFQITDSNTIPGTSRFNPLGSPEVAFNHNVLQDSVVDNVYLTVVNDDGNTVNVDFSFTVVDNVIKIKPTAGEFEEGKTYTLRLDYKIKDIHNIYAVDNFVIKSESGMTFLEPYILNTPFTVAIDYNILSTTPKSESLVNSLSKGYIWFSYLPNSYDPIKIEKKFEVPTEQLKHYYPLGGNGLDYFSTLNLQINSGVEYTAEGAGYRGKGITTTGESGSSFSFNKSYYIDSNNQLDFTVCCWIKAFGSGTSIFLKKTGIEDYIKLSYLRDVSAKFELILSGVSHEIDLGNVNTLDWYPLIFRFSNNNQIEIIFNDNIVFSGVSTINEWEAIVFGGTGRNGFDELYIYEKALTDTEITEWINEAYSPVIDEFIEAPTIKKEINDQTQEDYKPYGINVSVVPDIELNDGDYRYKIDTGFAFKDGYVYDTDFISNFYIGFTASSIIPVSDSTVTDLVNQISISFKKRIDSESLSAIKIYRVEGEVLRLVESVKTLTNPTASSSLVVCETEYTLGAGQWRVIIDTTLKTEDGLHIRKDFVSDFTIENTHTNYYMDDNTGNITFDNDSIEFWSNGYKN